ncbi:MAG: gamma-glutamyl-gamma-aminobutyrate hydrolase family protein [Pseudomonadota bacterium]
MTDTPVVLVPTDVREIDLYRWHMTPESYLSALEGVARCMPVLLPSLGNKAEIDAVLDRVDGVLLTGSRSNVHPDRYGVAASAAHEPYDPDRDETTLDLIRKTLSHRKPLLAICRGHQELNVAMGGTLATEIQTLDGRHDHRAKQSDDNDVRFAIDHEIHVEPGSLLHAILGAETVAVNSLHRQAIQHLANGLAVEAVADDGTIEAIRVTETPAFAYGVQWHPEYWAGTDGPSTRIFEAFGKVVRADMRGEDWRLAIGWRQADAA